MIPFLRKDPRQGDRCRMGIMRLRDIGQGRKCVVRRCDIDVQEITANGEAALGLIQLFRVILARQQPACQG